MKHIWQSLLLLGFISCMIHAQSQEKQSSANPFTGTWLRQGNNSDGGEFKLKTRQEGNHITFDLLIVYPPSHNTGYIAGKFDLNNSNGVFSTVTEYGRCEIAFKFTRSKVEINESGNASECGFGGGVYASGTLKRVDDGEPSFRGDPRF